MANIIKAVENKFQQIVTEQGYDLYDLEYVKENENYYLRVYIDSLTAGEKVGIEDCMKVTSAVNKYLDKEDPIEEAYMLEVSSPGIIRKLKKHGHYEAQVGNEISIKLYKKLDGFDSKRINGILEEVKEESIIFDGKEIAFTDIAKAETTFKF